MLALTLIPVALAEPLSPLPADTRLLEVQRHEEFARWHLEVPERDFWLELTADDGGEPVCRDGGWALWVRLDLEDHSESFDWEPLPAVVDQACADLPALAEPAAEEPVLPTAEGGWRPRALSLVFLGWFLAALVALPRTREAIGAFVMALGVRVALSRTSLLLGGDAAYERLLTARGHFDPDLYYGEGWAAVMGPLSFAFGDPPGLVHGMNVLFSALAVPLLVALMASLGATRAERYAAGVLLALSPLAISLAGSEVHFVLVATLQIGALLGAMRNDRLGEVLAVCSIGLLVHTRPLQGVFVLVPLFLLARNRRWLGLGLALALVGWRVQQLLSLPGGVGGGVIDWSRYLELGFLVRLIAPGERAVDLALNWNVTPFMVPLLAVAGLWATLRRERWTAALVPAVAGLLAFLPYAPKEFPFADPLRFQLPVQTWWIALAGFGLGLAWTWRPSRLLPILAVLVASIVVARQPHPRWVWESEYIFLRREAHRLGEDARVFMNPEQDPHGHMRTFLSLTRPPTFLSGQPEAEDYVYRGTADRHPGATWPFERCVVEPVAVENVPPATDGWVDLGPDLVELGLYRVISCPSAG
ncbi:MAG TPA: hypothetical protein QGF58_12335 [Myxococcota bacterium]|nr:hypothetical protein [Myxococcota bacterium]